MSFVRIHSLCHRSSHRSCHLQHSQSRPQIIQHHLWRKFIERCYCYRDVRNSLSLSRRKNLDPLLLSWCRNLLTRLPHFHGPRRRVLFDMLIDAKTFKSLPIPRDRKLFGVVDRLYQLLFFECINHEWYRIAPVLWNHFETLRLPQHVSKNPTNNKIHVHYPLFAL